MAMVADQNFDLPLPLLTKEGTDSEPRSRKDDFEIGSSPPMNSRRLHQNKGSSPFGFEPSASDL